ncbi:MAG: hypothetical protein U0794_06280 [Isosphaeraceae bacterium]
MRLSRLSTRHGQSGLVRSSLRLAGLAALWVGFSVPGARAEVPAAPSVASIVVHPAQAVLRGPDAVQQIAVDGVLGDSIRRDITAGSSFHSSNPAVATVEPSGTITAR